MKFIINLYDDVIIPFPFFRARVFSIALLLFAFIFSFAQNNFQIELQKCYGGTENETVSDMLIHNGFYYILGSTESDDGDIGFLHGGQDGWLIKATGSGEIIWEKTYGGTNGEHLLRIIPAPENAFYLLGSSYSSDGDITYDPYPESTDYWILKVDSTGNILWDKILGGNTLDQMWTGTSTNDGGVVALGWTGSNDGDVSTFYGFYDMWMVKLNSDGELEWDFTLGTSGLDAGQAIIQTSDGGFLVGGTSSIEDGGNLSCIPHSWKGEAILVKLDEDRNIEWQQCYGGSEHDGATALAELGEGYIFGGYAGSDDGDISGWHGENDIWIVKVDTLGNIIWQKCLGGSRSEFVSKLIVSEAGDILIPGNTKSIDGDVTGNHTVSEHEHDIWVVKLNGEGDLLWEQCFGGIWDEQVSFGFLKKGENNFVIAGQTDYGPSFDVACLPHGGEYDKDFWVFEVKDTTTNISSSIKENAINVYPNPAKEYVVFEVPSSKFRVRSWENKQIRITNTFGQQVALLPLKSEKTVWDTRDIQSGIYFYSLEIDGKVLCGKIVVQD